MIRAQFVLFWKFLGFFQKPVTRALHGAIVVLAALQLLGGQAVSTLMLGMPLPDAFPLWGHAANGLLILLLSLFLAVYTVYQRGLAHFFPYLFGNTAQLRSDIADSLHFKLVAPRSGGLASTVQGLGLGAVLLTALSGAVWLVFSAFSPSFAAMSIDIHPFAATLLVVYFVGHGAMSLLHFVVWQKKMRLQK